MNAMIQVIQRHFVAHGHKRLEKYVQVRHHIICHTRHCADSVVYSLMVGCRAYNIRSCLMFITVV